MRIGSYLQSVGSAQPTDFQRDPLKMPWLISSSVTMFPANFPSRDQQTQLSASFLSKHNKSMAIFTAWSNRRQSFSRIKWRNRRRNGSRRAMTMRTLIRRLVIVTRKLRQKRRAEAGNGGKRSDVFHGVSVCLCWTGWIARSFSVWFGLFSFIFLIASLSDLCGAEWREAATIFFYYFKWCCGTRHNFMLISLSERDRLRNWFAILCENE